MCALVNFCLGFFSAYNTASYVPDIDGNAKQANRPLTLKCVREKNAP